VIIISAVTMDMAVSGASFERIAYLHVMLLDHWQASSGSLTDPRCGCSGVCRGNRSPVVGWDRIDNAGPRAGYGRDLELSVQDRTAIPMGGRTGPYRAVDYRLAGPWQML
jgi:hypothetical protein